MAANLKFNIIREEIGIRRQETGDRIILNTRHMSEETGETILY